MREQIDDHLSHIVRHQGPVGLRVRQTAEARIHRAWQHVRDADAAHLPLGEGEAHRYRADKVYHVLPDPNAPHVVRGRFGEVTIP